jgi:hypothetical protein
MLFRPYAVRQISILQPSRDTSGVHGLRQRRSSNLSSMRPVVSIVNDLVVVGFLGCRTGAIWEHFA